MNSRGEEYDPVGITLAQEKTVPPIQLQYLNGINEATLKKFETNYFI